MNLIENPLTTPLLAVPEPLRTRRQQALEILGAALAAVDPAAAIRNALNFDPATNQLKVGGQIYDLGYYQRIFVVGAGKAGTPMLQAVAELLGERLTAGIVIVKYAHGPTGDTLPANFKILEAGHPVLDEGGLAATRQMLQLLDNLTERDLVITLISGGGSALLESLVEPITLTDLQTLTQALLRSGATINDLNAVRKHLSAVKGGQLARWAAPATVLSLILSDVVGSPLDVIGSGPTVPDPTTFQQAGQILQKYNLTEANSNIWQHFQRGLAGQIAETPKPGDPLFQRVQNLVIADNRIAALAALDKANQLGFQTMLLSTFVQGEAREVAQVVAAIAREVKTFGQPVAAPACLVLGGETTVTIRGEGLGGRNQELALAAALAIEGLSDVMIVTLATDGSDGPTDAVGGFAEGDTVAKARQLGLDPPAFLQHNDSYHFLEKVGNLLKTGPTNTNVNDLTLMLIW